MSKALTLPTASPPLRSRVTGSAARGDSELDAWFDLCSSAALLVEGGGRVVRHNAALRDLVGKDLQALSALPQGMAPLLGWPGEMPTAGERNERSGWVMLPQGRQCRLRVKVRGITTPTEARRWLVLIDDLSVEDERDLARVEIEALMGTAGVGVATYDAAQGWVSAAPPRETTGERGTELTDGQGPMSISRELIEAESMPQYDRLQHALRTSERTEVRYAVKHKDLGRRWLLTRVEPAQLAPGRPALSVVTLDVTEEETARRRNEQLLRELATILEVSPSGIAYFRDEALLRCNRRFETLLGVGDGGAARSTVKAALRLAGVEASALQQALAALHEHGSCDLEFTRTATEGAALRHYTLSLRRVPDAVSGVAETVAVLADVTRLRSQQAALRGLERERELMFSLSDVGIVYQREDRIERANQAMAELTGYDPEQLQTMPMSALYVDATEYAHYIALEQDDLARCGRAHGERRLKRRDGSVVWAQVNLRPVEAGDPAAGRIASFVNVDERRRAREQLQQQAERTRAILDSVLVGIVTVGENGIEWMNRSARRMFAGELSDFIGQPIGIVADADADHPLRRTDWLSTLQEGQAETFECRLVARDARHFWVVGNVVETGHETSGGRQLTFALLDIERRRHAEMQTAQARASLQRIIETAPLAIALFDAGTQQVLQLNQMVEQYAGLPATDILGRPPHAWLPEPEADALVADLQQARTSQEIVGRESLRAAVGTDGVAPPQVWDTRIVSLGRNADAPDQLLLVASDVTEQRAADAARLEAAIAQREMLIKEVHHRIKNNLQGVAGLLQQNAERHPEAASAIAEAVGHVHAIAQVHGLQVGVTGPLRMRGVLEAIASSVQRMFGRTIHTEVEGDAPHRFALAEADSIPIALTINELLTNAIKHSANGGDIRCTLRCFDAHLVIAIANKGTLVPDFNLARVPAGISGLGLVRALLPRKGASMLIEQQGDEVLACLSLKPPAVTLLTPL